MSGPDGAPPFADVTALTEVFGDDPKTQLLTVLLAERGASAPASVVEDMVSVEPAALQAAADELAEWGIVSVKSGGEGDPMQYALDTDNEAARCIAMFEMDLVRALADERDDNGGDA